MEKTKTLLFMLPAVALFLFVACSGENDLTAETPTAQQKETPSNAIGFDAYLNRTTTRAGWAGELNLTNLQSTGFGVFAYYGDGDLYSENLVPNFMYNQHVTYAISTDKWTYEPVKYWPNEFGSSAVSVGVDRVSFFAYAPYVAVEPSSGLLTSYYDNTIGTPGEMDEYEKLTETGITWLSRNGKGGDPYVRYVTSFESAKCVDLCYGLAAENFTSSVDGGDGINNVKKGQPYLNVAKPTTDSRIKFDFKHALAKLKVQVDADVDVASHSDGGDPDVVDGMTRVWVRSITFEGVSQRGFLNMRTGTWHEVMDGKKISHATVTIYDGRRDGSEAISDDTYEEITGFNSQLIQDVAYTTTLGTTSAGAPTYSTFSITKSGVTYDYKDLFDGNLMVIPANEQLKVTIVYDVETADATLPNYLSDGKTKGSTIENKITKAITLGGNPLKLESGNAYTINLHLGLNSVKFDAKVTEWDQNNTADNPWLPENGPSIKAGTPDYPYSVPAAGGEYKFRITDLTAGSTRTSGEVSDDDDIVTGVSFANEDNVSGILTATVAENKSVKKKEATVKLDESGTATITTTIKITQAPHPLELSVNNVSDTKTIVLNVGTGVLNAWDDITDATKTYGNPATRRIQVKKNGTALEGVSTTASTGQFSFASGTITLGDAPAVGDVYTITVKAGDADVETVTFTIGGIAFAPNIYNVEYGTTGFAPTPIAYGGTLGAYSDASSTVTAVADVTSASNPTITIKKVGTATISMKNTLDPVDAGYFVTTGSQTASYTLNVTKAAGTITYANGSGSISSTTEGKYIGTYTAVLKNSHGNIMTAGADDGGTVTYSIVSVKKGDQVLDNECFKLNPAYPGALDVGPLGAANLVNGNTYTVVLRATVTGNDNAGYAVNTADATITLTTPSP